MVRNSKTMSEIAELEVKPDPGIETKIKSVLNFISTAQSKLVEINDGLGNIVAVPSKGSANCTEYNRVMQLLYQMQKDNSLATRIETEVVIICLRHRYKLAKTVTDESVLLGEDGEIAPISLIKKLYEFFMEELQLKHVLDAQKTALQGNRLSAINMEDAAPYLES